MVDEFVLLAKIRRSLPDTFHGLTDVETRYRQRYLDLLVNEETRADFALRTRMVSAIRRYLDERGFVEVETPVLQPRYGGAFAEPFVTHYKELDADFYLRIATELYLKRLIVGGLERVYELGKDFRNEGISYKHAPEFTMLEWYEAYADYSDTMARIEELVESVARETTGGTQGRLPRPRDRPEGALATAQARRRPRGTGPLDARRGRAALAARGARGGHQTGQELGAARRPCAQPLRRTGADPADDPARLPGRALAFRPHDRRGPVDCRTLRVLRRWDGARQCVQRVERPRRAGGSGSPSKPPRSAASPATRTTSRRSRTGCRRRAASASASTGWRWC